MTQDFIDHVGAKRKLRREVVSVALTTWDVYPGDEWNFVYGLAQASSYTGVWSLARYDPAFFDMFGVDDDEPPTDEDRDLILRRTIKVSSRGVGDAVCGDMRL